MSPTDRAVGTVALLLVLAGVAVLAAASGFVAALAGALLLGLGALAIVALVFLLVGESEERDRGA